MAPCILMSVGGCAAMTAGRGALAPRSSPFNVHLPTVLLREICLSVPSIPSHFEISSSIPFPFPFRLDLHVLIFAVPPSSSPTVPVPNAISAETPRTTEELPENPAPPPPSLIFAVLLSSSAPIPHHLRHLAHAYHVCWHTASPSPPTPTTTLYQVCYGDSPEPPPNPHRPHTLTPTRCANEAPDPPPDPHRPRPHAHCHTRLLDHHLTPTALAVAITLPGPVALPGPVSPPYLAPSHYHTRLLNHCLTPTTVALALTALSGLVALPHPAPSHRPHPHAHCPIRHCRTAPRGPVALPHMALSHYHTRHVALPHSAPSHYHARPVAPPRSARRTAALSGSAALLSAL